MDGSIHPAATQHALIGGVDDGVDLRACQVSPLEDEGTGVGEDEGASGAFHQGPLFEFGHFAADFVGAKMAKLEPVEEPRK